MFITKKKHNKIVNGLLEQSKIIADGYKKEIQSYLERITELTKCPENEWKRQAEYHKSRLEEAEVYRGVIVEKYDQLKLQYDEVYKVLKARETI